MGNAPSKTFDPVKDLPNLSGKVVIVTGSSRGIGFASLQYFARLGAKVYMASSNESRAKAALERLESDGSAHRVTWMHLDLKDPRSAKAAAEKFIAENQRLDILVNNAALIPAMGQAELTSDGIQESMAINYLGPFVFTQTLLPLLESTAATRADVRIINVGSGAHRGIKKVNYASKETWNQQFRWSLLPVAKRYAYSKLAFHLWSNHLAKELETKQSTVILILADPGAILSDGVIANIQRLRVLSRVGTWVAKKLMHPQSHGAYTTLFAAGSPRENPAISNGNHIGPPNIVVPQDSIAHDERLQAELVDYTKQFLEQIGVVL